MPRLSKSFFLWFLTAILLTGGGTVAHAKPNILILQSYHKGYTWTDRVMDGMNFVLQKEVPDAELFVEIMDTKRHAPENLFPELHRLYTRKYGNEKVRFDVILCADDNALDFLLVYRDELFPGVPVVFCGINDFEDARIAGHRGYTGVTEQYDLQGTLDIALKLHPDTERVAVVNDITPSGRANMARLQKIAPRFYARVNFINLDGLTAPALQEALAALPAHTVVLLLSYFRDVEGRNFTVEEGNALVCQSSRRPVYTPWDFKVKAGVVGGRVVSGRKQGETAARLALRILRGQAPESIPVIRQSPNVFMFDYQAMRRWGIDRKKLPQSSVVLGDPKTVFWARAEHFFLVSTLAVIFAALTLWLAISLKQRKKMTEALTESKGTLDAILKSIGDPMTMVDRELNILWGNDPAKSIFGEDIIGKKCYEAFHQRSEPCEPYPCHVLKAFDDRQIHKAESLITDRNGQELCFLSAANVALSDQDEVPTAVLQVCRDITTIKRIQKELLLAKFANDSSANPIAIADLHGRLTYVNRSLLELWGYSTRQDVLGKQIFNFFKDPDAGQHAMRMLKLHGEWHGELQGFKNDGSLFMVKILANVVSNSEGEPVSLAASFTDVTEVKKAEEKIKQLAYFDALTGLPNRTLLKNRMELAINHGKRAGETAAILLFDLDNFKNVNDTLGHAKGDQLLQEVASRIRPQVRKADTFARWGGDEFVLLLIDIKDEEAAAIVAEKILNRLSKHPFDLEGNEVQLSASIGIALCPRDGEDSDLLLERADLALYESKKAGRNTYHFFSEQMNAKTAERYEMEKSLWRALQQEEFSLVYQPQVDLSISQITGVEALMRWQSPEKGLLFPRQFLFVAEEARLVHALGEWTLRTACRQAVEWQQMGHGPLQIAVNFSALQFRQPDFVALVEQVLQETGLSPHLLELEITESALMDRTEKAIKTLAALKTLGIRIAIDDFGMGQSSLNDLKLFPVDRLKIAQDFVGNMLVEPKDAAIVESIIDIARKFKLQVIAEGVETQEQLEFFQRHGCLEMQGHYFTKPMDHEAVSVYLKKRDSLQITSLTGCQKVVALLS